MVKGEWDVARIAADAFDLEGKVVGTVGAGRIGQRVLQRLKVGALLSNLLGRHASERAMAVGGWWRK